ncbi:hypothetical protein Tco_0319004 [Tanacetum coccineum]
MVLQLTDFTSEITDEELLEFTSEYYIPFALHPVVPAASASIVDFPEGKVGVYTRFFEFANQRRSVPTGATAEPHQARRNKLGQSPPPAKSHDCGYISRRIGDRSQGIFEGIASRSDLMGSLIWSLLLSLRQSRRESGGAVGEAGGEVTQTQHEYDDDSNPHMFVRRLADARRNGEGTEEKRLLTSACRNRYPGYNLMHMRKPCVIMAGLTLARHATEGAEAQPDYFLNAPDDANYSLQESLEAHAIRLAKKKGVKGKAILCGVGAAHIPRSDGVPVSVATVSPKDSELLGKLEEAGDACSAQVGSLESVVVSQYQFFLPCQTYRNCVC